MIDRIEASLQAMRRGLDLRPDEIDTGGLLPMFAPAAFFASGKWPGPSLRLRAREIGLTWTVLMPSQTMRYVNFAMQEYWDARRLDWKELAMKNLAKQTENAAGMKAMRRADGSVSALAFMFEDGLGPSRLLFRGSLNEQFPEGYRVAIPEMSCGIAYSRNLDGGDLASVQGVIDHCYRRGTRPLAAETYDSDDLLPA